MAVMKQYYPSEKDELAALRARRRRLGVLWLEVHKKIKELEAQKPKLEEEVKKHWWSNITKHW